MFCNPINHLVTSAMAVSLSVYGEIPQISRLNESMDSGSRTHALAITSSQYAPVLKSPRQRAVPAGKLLAPSDGN